MNRHSLYETKNRLSEFCSRVAKTHEPLVITHRGRPYVKIVPFEAEAQGSDVWESVEEEQRRYGPLTDELELPERSLKNNRSDPLEC